MSVKANLLVGDKMTERLDPWKYCSVDPARLKSNPYVNPPNSPDDVRADDDGTNDSADSGEDDNVSDVKILNDNDFLVLENLVCYGNDGHPFEQYDNLRVMKDIVRKPDNKHRSFKPYDAIVHFEDQNNSLFVPSYALQCAILVALYQNRSDAEINQVLMQYGDYGPGYGWHNNNTVVDGKNGKIIHYPQDSDFPNNGGTKKINKSRTRIIKPFPKNMHREGQEFDDMQKDVVKVKYFRDLTGLKDFAVLNDIARLFGKPAKFWPAANNSTCSAWLGCGYSNFIINSYYVLSGNYAVRGVASHR